MDESCAEPSLYVFCNPQDRVGMGSPLFFSRRFPPPISPFFFLCCPRSESRKRFKAPCRTKKKCTLTAHPSALSRRRDSSLARSHSGTLVSPEPPILFFFFRIEHLVSRFTTDAIRAKSGIEKKKTREAHGHRGIPDCRRRPSGFGFPRPVLFLARLSTLVRGLFSLFSRQTGTPEFA